MLNVHRWVSLRRCSLGSLQPTQFPVDGLLVLRVGGNPLVCNCSVHWLWNVLRAEEQRRNGSASSSGRLEIDAAEIICSDEEFAGKALANLPEGALRCRLNPLYLALSVAGCLVATAAVLALVAYVARMKRSKRVPPYAAPTRPELLVYVGRAADGLPDKHHESYSRRLIGRTEDLVYEAANQGELLFELFNLSCLMFNLRFRFTLLVLIIQIPAVLIASSGLISANV